MISIDYKYYQWIALVPGWVLGDFIGAVAAFFLVREIMSDKQGEIRDLRCLCVYATVVVRYCS